MSSIQCKTFVPSKSRLYLKIKIILSLLLFYHFLSEVFVSSVKKLGLFEINKMYANQAFKGCYFQMGVT